MTNALISGTQRTQMGATWAHDLLSPLGPKGTFQVIEDFLSGVHGPQTLSGRTALSNLKNDLEFIRTGLKSVVTSVSPRTSKPAPFSVRAMFDRVRDRYARSAEENRITWIVSQPPEPLRIIADEPAIERRVLGNLVENALRHTPSGGTVEVGYRIEDKNFVGFVRDTGPGISKEDLPKLFCPGTQLDPNNKGLAGLGLASVKSVIEFHNGRVWVESELGKGSTFYFSLPFQEPYP